MVGVIRQSAQVDDLLALCYLREHAEQIKARLVE
jgi:hypothetical protein